MKRTGRIIETTHTLVKRNEVTEQEEDRVENQPYSFFIDQLVEFFPAPGGGTRIFVREAGGTLISEPYEELLRHVLEYEQGRGMELLRRQ